MQNKKMKKQLSIFLNRLKNKRYWCCVLAMISVLALTLIDHQDGEKKSELDNHVVSVKHVENSVQNKSSIIVNEKIQQEQQQQQQPLHLVICAVVKDEAPYLQEWIEHHRMIGFDEILLFNDHSIDSTQCILDAYAAANNKAKEEDGFVVMRMPQDIITQNASFLHSQPFDQCSTIRACEEYIRNRGGSTYRNTWMLTHDVDEFIWFNSSTSHTSSSSSSIPAGNELTFKNVLRRLIREHEQHDSNINDDASTTLTITPVRQQVRSLNIPRLVFGSSDHNHYQPNSFVMERFTHRYNHEICPPKNRRPIWRTDFYHTSYCDAIYMAKTSIDNVKSMTWVPALPTSCRKGIVFGCELAHGQQDDRQRCITPHIHKLQQLNNYTTLKKSQDALPAHVVLDTVAIMHYATKSREEFFDRTCKSVWLSKYMQCASCSPEAAFNVTQSYANNYKDERMLPFAERLRNIMLETQQQQQEMTFPVLVHHCKIISPPSHRGWDYYRECWSNRMNATKKK